MEAITLEKEFCPFVNGQCRKDCKFFRRASDSDCSIASGLNMLYEVSTLLDGVYQELKEK
jgi:hypothetical protein